MTVGPDLYKRAGSEKKYARTMVVIGDGFTPDKLILQGKSHQFMYLRGGSGGGWQLSGRANAGAPGTDSYID